MIATFAAAEMLAPDRPDGMTELRDHLVEAGGVAAAELGPVRAVALAGRLLETAAASLRS